MRISTCRQCQTNGLQSATEGEPVLIEPRRRNIVGAIVKLREIPDAYLYTIRLVDPEVIKARQIVTREHRRVSRPGGDRERRRRSPSRCSISA